MKIPTLFNRLNLIPIYLLARYLSITFCGYDVAMTCEYFYFEYPSYDSRTLWWSLNIWKFFFSLFWLSERMKGWVGWPIADGLPTLVVTHQLQFERRTGKVRRPETDVLPTVPRHQPAVGCRQTNYPTRRTQANKLTDQLSYQAATGISGWATDTIRLASSLQIFFTYTLKLFWSLETAQCRLRSEFFWYRFVLQ